MQVLTLIGSLRKESLNRKVFEAYKKIAGGGSLEFIEGDYSKFPLYSEEIQKQGFPADVTKLGEQIKAADAVLFISPEYNYSVPGPLKNAIDWISRLPERPFAGKPASVMGASMGRLGTARMQYHLRQIGVFLDLHFMNMPEVMVGSAHTLFNEAGTLTDEPTSKVLKSHADAFEKHIKHVKA
jgi:chromate reductase, NAD(P)H dehydrogenase (quinone)